MSTQKLQVFDSPAMPWEERFIPELGKALFAKRFLAHPSLRPWHVRAGRDAGDT